MLADFLRLLLRRWVLSLLVLVLALAGGAATLVVVTPVQRSDASVLFVPPNQDATIQGTINPFLALGGGLGVVPSVIQATVTDDNTVQHLLDAGHKGTYTVIVDVAQNAAPILLVSVASHTVADSVGTRDAVVAQIETQLEALQVARGVDPRYIISAAVLTKTPQPVIVRTGQIQAAAVVVIALLVLGAGVIGLMSRGPHRSKRRRHARPVDHDPGRRTRASRSGGPAAVPEVPAETAGPAAAHTAVPDDHQPSTVAVLTPPPPPSAPVTVAPLVPVDATPPAPVIAASSAPVTAASRANPRRRAQQLTRPPNGRTSVPVGSHGGRGVDRRS